MGGAVDGDAASVQGVVSGSGRGDMSGAMSCAQCGPELVGVDVCGEIADIEGAPGGDESVELSGDVRWAAGEYSGAMTAFLQRGGGDAHDRGDAGVGHAKGTKPLVVLDEILIGQARGGGVAVGGHELSSLGAGFARLHNRGG